MIIEGGNFKYKDFVWCVVVFVEKGIYYFDVGISGGMEGVWNGVCMMIGGDKEVFVIIEFIFCDINVENGYFYLGVVGSGYFLKMVYNGIEYGMM